MSATRELLTAVQKKHGFTSDYQLHKHFGVSRQMISNYMNGTTMGADMAIKVADDLGLTRAAVLAAVEVERAKTDEARKAWKDAVKRLGGIAATVLVSTGLIGAPSPAPAQGATPTPCVLCQLRRCRCRRPVSSLGAALGRSLAHVLGVKTHRLA